MARGYPHYLFSDPQNTKSNGPFVINTIFPKFIARIDVFGAKKFDFTIEIIEYWDVADAEHYLLAQGQMISWLKSQIIKGDIELSYEEHRSML